MAISKEDLFKRHLSRLRASLASHSLDTICEFITAHTKIRGAQFSFEGHEYQEEILRDPSDDICIIKSAQIGISEMSARKALADSALVNGFNTIYTLPSASAAQNFMKTRVDPVIEESDYLRELVDRSMDNSSVKKLGQSFLYLRGAQVDRQAISIPADQLIIDEVDNSSQEVITLYESRLIHSAYHRKIKLSTPTIPGFGIDLLYQQSRRKVNMVKCHVCNHWYYPDYYEHVKIPGFDKHLDEITKEHFSDPSFLWAQAYLACPRCGSEANLMPAHRSWVFENPSDAFPTTGYRISPFDCPTIIKTPALVRASVNYERKQDFVNQRLGKPLEDAEASLAEDELRRCFVDGRPEGSHSYVMGLDMGLTCWMTIAAVFPDGSLVVVRVLPIPMGQLQGKFSEMMGQYSIRMAVIDHLPYTETVYQLQQRHRNVFAAVYSTSKDVELFRLKDQEEDKGKGKLDVRYVSVNRNSMFDLIMARIRSGQVQKVGDEYNDAWVTHLINQKRVRQFKGDQLIFDWVKTTGNDHLHHSLLYAEVASRILGVSAGCQVRLPLLSKFKVKDSFYR